MTQTFRLASFTALVALSVLAQTGAASAQPRERDDNRARMHFLAGNSYFTDGRYTEAALQFLDAYRLSGRIELLLNVALSYERADEPRLAADAVEDWLEVAPADAPNRAEQEARLTRLRALQEAREQAAATTQAQAETPAPEAEATEARRGLGTLGVVGITLLGVGGATGGLAIGTGVASSARLDELERGCDATRSCPPELEATRDKGRTLATVSTIGTFVSVASLGAGVALLVRDLRHRDERPATDTAVIVTPGPGDVGLGVLVAF